MSAQCYVCGRQVNKPREFLCDECRALDEGNKHSICPACGGDGIETCDNPDHAFITAIGGEIERLGCPCCGHDPNYKMKGPCPECNGLGIASIDAVLKGEK